MFTISVFTTFSIGLLRVSLTDFMSISPVNLLVSIVLHLCLKYNFSASLGWIKFSSASFIAGFTPDNPNAHPVISIPNNLRRSNIAKSKQINKKYSLLQHNLIICVVKIEKKTIESSLYLYLVYRSLLDDQVECVQT